MQYSKVQYSTVQYSGSSRILILLLSNAVRQSESSADSMEVSRIVVIKSVTGVLA